MRPTLDVRYCTRHIYRNVIPAKAGIQYTQRVGLRSRPDPRLRGDDIFAIGVRNGPGSKLPAKETGGMDFRGGETVRQRVFFMIVLGLCCIMPAARAVTLSVPANVTAGPGQAFQVAVSITNVQGLFGYYFTLSYSSQIDFQGIQKGPLTAAWGDPYGTQTGTGHCSVAGFGAEQVNGAGTLAFLRFRVKPTAPNGHLSVLNFSEAELNDGAIPVTTQNGQVRVAQVGVLLLPATVHTYPGGDFTVPVEIDCANQVLGYYLELSYDSGVLAFVEGHSTTVTPPGTQPRFPPEVPADWGAPIVNDSELNRLVVAGMGATALNGPYTLVYLTFHVRDETPLFTETYLDFNDAELNDGELAVVAEGALIDIGDPNALPMGGWAVLLTPIALLALAAVRRARRRAP